MTDVIKHDPRGLVQHDMKHLRTMFKRKRYHPLMSHGEIMFEEGKQKVLDYIEDKMIAKRGTNGIL